MGIFGPPNIEKLVKKTNVKGLLKALIYKDDWEIRQQAAEAIGKLQLQETKSHLISCLETDDSEKVRQSVVRTLAALNYEDSITILARFLKFDKSKNVRLEIINILKENKTEEAISPLVDRLMNDENIAVRKSAADALDAIGWLPEKNNKSGAYYWEIRRDINQLAKCGQNGIEILLPMVLDGDREARDVYFTIGEPALIALINATETMYQFLVANISNIPKLDMRSKADQGKRETIKYITNRLERCISMIGLFGTEKAEDYLVEFYSKIKDSIYSHADSGWLDLFNAVELRQSISVSLRYTKGSRSISLLGNILRNDPAKFVKWDAADSIMEIANESLEYVRNSDVLNDFENLVLNMEAQIRTSEIRPGSGGYYRCQKYRGFLESLKVS